LVVLLNVLSGKLSIAGLTVKLAVAKFVLWQLFCESLVSRNGNRNCFVKVIAAPVFSMNLVLSEVKKIYLRLVLLKRKLSLMVIVSLVKQKINP
jgi:hypothetical protein